jgi:hypothetical protein
MFESRQGQDFSLLRSVYTGSGANPASYPLSKEALSPKVKLPRREADNSPPSSVEIKNGGAAPSLLKLS